MLEITLLSLFPEYFDSPLQASILRIAREGGFVQITTDTPRRFSEERHQRVDDRPFGGGPGMLMMAPPLLKAIRHHRKPDSKVIYLAPTGTPFSQKIATTWSQCSSLIFVCGHYEGIDQRVIDLEIDEVVSIGDYILSSGMAAALVAVDAVVRLIPGVLGDPASIEEESFSQGLLEAPHYTRPLEVEGLLPPEVLRSGNHQAIAAWRHEQSYQRTKSVRPDLLP